MIISSQFLKFIACFLSSFTIVSSSPRRRFPVTLSGRRFPVDPNEDLFIRLYGKDRFEAARWRRIRYFREDTEKLRNISIQAHVNAGLGSDDVIHSAIFEAKALHFVTAKFFDARLRVDTIVYSVEREPKKKFFLTKGMKSGCVHYLEKLDDRYLVFKLGKHVCGIDLPVKEPMLNFLSKS